MAQAVFAAGLLDENAAHRLGGGGEEMPAILEGGLSFAHEPEPGFVHERGRLESVAGRLVRHLRRSQFAQLLIDEREQLLGCLGVALLNAVEDLSDVAHAPEWEMGVADCPRSNKCDTGEAENCQRVLRMPYALK